LKTFAVSLVVLLLAGCATPETVVLPPEIIKVPVFMPLPAECGQKVTVDLPVGSTAVDVMTKQDKALDEANSKIEKCFGPASGPVL
jgi:hypothetical protein